MLKEAKAGRVKTRLARGVGVARAAAFYRTAVRLLLTRLTAPRRWVLHLAIAPDGAVATRSLPAGHHRFGQGSGDLGDRMQAVMDRLPPGPVVIVGSDCPGLRAADVAAAFRALGRADVAIAPAPDGGYGLVGLRRRPMVPRLFAGVRWSHRETLADTLRNAAGLDVALLQPLADVDEAKDLRHPLLRRLVGRLVLPKLTC
ncbi:MAG: TIGR04282 family arsenosugar biosynthesis glycosyltransferase [Hyphomicrobiaceae bacterium]|nr:TIGR04282 family arsenosugar biosynthesis glycosyltransferase [Hyphomicrobiaceae bacterium]